MLAQLKNLLRITLGVERGNTLKPLQLRLIKRDALPVIGIVWLEMPAKNYKINNNRLKINITYPKLHFL